MAGRLPALEERVFTLPDDYSSQALRAAVSHLDSPGRKSILDLGRPSDENVGFFSELDCKVFVSDFFDCLNEAGPASRLDGEAFAGTCERLLDFPVDTRFELIVAWDLFNYLELEEVAVLVGHLSRFCERGARLMALVAIYRQIPDHPFDFSISDGERVRYELVSEAQRPAPLHQEPDLLRCLDGFEVETCMLLRHGMREYCLARSQREP